MTRHRRRTVLVVVPSVTAGTWLLDTLSLLAGDRRIATFCTIAPREKGMACRGVAEFLRTGACPVLPWRHAVRYEFDLVLTAGSRGLAGLLGDLCYDRLLASIPFRAAYRHVFGLSRGQKLVLVPCSGMSTVDSVVDLLARLLSTLPSERYRVGALVSPDVWCGQQVRARFADLVHSGLLLPRPDEGWRGTLVAANLLIGGTGMTLRYGAAIGVPVLLASSADSSQQDGVGQAGRDGVGDVGLGGVGRVWRGCVREAGLGGVGRVWRGCVREAGLGGADRAWRGCVGKARLDGADGLVRRHAPRLRPDRPLLDQVEAAMRADRAWQDGVAERINSRPGYAGDLLRRRIYGLLDLAEPTWVAPCRPVSLPRFSPD